MPFQQKYTVIPRYLPVNTKRRSGLAITPSVKFIVAHDTGNADSTAAGNVAYYIQSCNDLNASAHLFVDDKEIIECIPALTAVPEKAWHVRYDVTGDNNLYGFEANDTAIAVEYCFGANINAAESYKRYVWTLAYICFKFNLEPAKAIVGHFILDPARRTDPRSGLAVSGRTYEQLLKDVVTEFNACTNQNKPMRLVKSVSSTKIYAVGADNKKHWIFNEETFNIGKEMGLWGDWSTVEIVGDNAFIDGHAILLVK